MVIGTNWVFKHKYLQMFDRKYNKYMTIFYTLEVVGRGSETQLQLGENLNYCCDVILIAA